MTSFIAAVGSGRSVSFIPAFPEAWSVTTIALIVHLPACEDTVVANRHEPLLKYRPAMIQSHLSRARSAVRAKAVSWNRRSRVLQRNSCYEAVWLLAIDPGRWATFAGLTTLFTVR